MPRVWLGGARRIACRADEEISEQPVVQSPRVSVRHESDPGEVVGGRRNPPSLSYDRCHDLSPYPHRGIRTD